ncbi:MAG TPA: response regulator transcription factor [Candidatus Eisenbacteria bacterium]|jgi:DNA-binding NarL/FixJ family response regulator|nr:response regulator transcription factor [Candidatus Eisenbacteria bacterium]
MNTVLLSTRVYLVDDHPLVRESLASLIERQPDLNVCGEADTAAAALAGIAETDPDVAIVDLSLGEQSGLDLIRQINLEHPHVAVLVLSMHDEALFAVRALRAGARGYIMKREASGKVILAIRRVRDGAIAVSERVTDSLTAKLFRGGGVAQPGSPIESLSDRELDVFRLLGEGRSTKQIAAALNLSSKTVQAYYARIKDKLGAESALELLREAIRWSEPASGSK